LFLGFLNFEREEKEILGTKEGECMKEWKDKAVEHIEKGRK